MLVIFGKRRTLLSLLSQPLRTCLGFCLALHVEKSASAKRCSHIAINNSGVLKGSYQNEQINLKAKFTFKSEKVQSQSPGD